VVETGCFAMAPGIPMLVTVRGVLGLDGPGGLSQNLLMALYPRSP
jgi:hypothetical protein